MKDNIYILGINSAYHESSAALIQNGKLIAMVEEERLNRVKHAKCAKVDNPDELPVKSIEYCLSKAQINWNNIDYIGYSIEPSARKVKNSEYISTYPIPDGTWGTKTGEQIFYDKCISIPQKLSNIANIDIKDKFHFIPHHICHAASAYFVSPFDESAILIMDGIAEFSSTWLGYGKNNSITQIKEIDFPNSLGFLWEKFAKFFGFSEYDACKVMGLATCGKFYIPGYITKNFEKIAKTENDGSFTIDDTIMQFRNEDYSHLTKMFYKEKRDKKIDPTATIQELVLAQALQKRTEEIILHITDCLLKETLSKNLSLAGGTALNSVVNGKIEKNYPDINMFIQPASHDAGTALGAAYYLWNVFLNNPKTSSQNLSHAYWGPDYSSEEIEECLKNSSLEYTKIDSEEELINKTAQYLAQNNIIAWFQGRMEIGPRALGNRSIIANPSDSAFREKLNSKGIKDREEFRPFAPSVIEEDAPDWFDIKTSSPYMLNVYNLKPSKIGKIDAVVHYDGTSRIQTVNEQQNPRYYRLLREFKEITGIPLLLNTSFNSQEPIVCSPYDAIKTYSKTGLDYLVIGNYIAKKRI